ncbi:unc-22, partial [Symbiodinium necroappetens]
SESAYLESYTASLPDRVSGLNARATHVSPTELLYNWIPLLGATEIGSTDFSILKGYELWMDDGLGGKFSRTYDGYNKPFETYFVATGLVSVKAEGQRLSLPQHTLCAVFANRRLLALAHFCIQKLSHREVDTAVEARKSGNMKLMCAAVELQMRLALATRWLKSCVPMLQPEKTLQRATFDAGSWQLDADLLLDAEEMLPQTETEFELGVAIRSGTIHDLSAALESAEEYLQDQQMNEQLKGRSSWRRDCSSVFSQLLLRLPSSCPSSPDLSDPVPPPLEFFAFLDLYSLALGICVGLCLGPAVDLLPGRTYRAYVRAVNVVGSGPDSDVLYRAMAVEPSAPSDLQVASAGAEEVLCSWKPPQDNGGEPVLHYVLEYAPEPLFNTWQEDGPYPDNTQFTKTIFNLGQGLVYQFRIRAVTNAGGGSYSNVVSQVVGTAPTAAPSGLTRASTTSVSLTWAWSPLPVAQTGGAPLGGYRLYMNTGRDDVTSLVYDGSDKPSATEFTATSLVCGRVYKAEVSAVTSIGEGPRSSMAAFKLAHTPSQPRSARVLASSTGSITLAWDIPESTGCTELEYYRIERDTGQGFEPVANVSTPIQTYTDTGDLSPGQMYIYRIAARNDALDYFGPHSSHVTAFAASLPGMPRNLGYVTSTRTAITLMWDPPADTGGAMVDFYRVQADDGLGGAFGDVAVVAGTYTTIEYLTPGRPYRFRVAAETVVGTGPYTAVFQQVVAAVPSNPQTPIVETIPGYMDRVRVTWAEPSDNGGSLTLGYKVTFDGQCDRYDGTSVASITSVQIICVTGQHHLITVAARNVVGWGGPSPSVSRVCGAEPDAPADLRLKMNVPSQPLDMVDLRTPSSMTLTWNVPTVDGGNPVTSYQLYRDAGDSSGIYTLAYAGTMASVTLHSLSNGKTYRFYAVAVNDVGPGARTSVFSAEMRCTPRSLVAAPYKVSGSPWSISIAWPETADNCGRAVSSYRVYRDGNLVFPLSNEFHAPPALVGAISSDSVTLRITAKESGSAWAILVKDDDKASRGSEGDKSRGETLSECLKSLVNSGSKWQDLSRTNEVHFVDGEVVTKYSSIGVDFSLPLLCTDVTWTRIPTPDFDSMQQTPFDRAETEEIPEVKFLIGLAPRWKRLQMAPLECFDEGTDEFWVLCASFQVGTPEMESFLSVLQRSGALRWDIDEEYVFHRQVIGRGSSSISRRGLLRRSFCELSTLVDESHSEEEPASPPCDPVAIKITKHPESDEEAQSIVNEVRFLAASCQHPNIVQLLGTFCAKWRGKSLWLLALELCSGGRLQDHVKIYGHLEPIAGEGASVGLFSAVAHLHGRRILHRDIRPQNILLAENLRPVLVNFGNACSFEDVSCLSARRTARADGYTAPEVIDGRLGTQGPASDVFSTAATVLLMLTGIEPCNEAKSAEQTLTGNARLDELAASKLSQSTVALLQRLLARHARKRPTACQACMMLHEEAAEEVQELSVFEKAVTALSMTLAATGGADRGSHVGLASIDESEALEELMQSAVEGCSSFAGGAPTLPESDLAGGYSASGLAQPPPPPGGAGPAPLPLEPTSPTSSPSSSSFVPQPPSGPSPRKGGRVFMGRILHVVDPSRFDTLYTPAPTSTAPKVKAGMDAVGRLSCRGTAVPVVAGVEREILLHGCGLMGMGWYSVFAYVESYDALDNDGSLYGPLRFQVPASSNSFAVPPEIQMPVTKDGLAVTFTPMASAGTE